MTSVLRPIVLTCGLLLGASDIRAQSAAAPPRTPAGVGEIRGRIVEATSQQPLTGGSITVRRASDSAFAGGALPRADGSFKVDGLPVGRYTIRVRALGHAPLARGGIVITAEQPIVELGALTLSTVATTLEGQVVTAEREEVTVAPDRNSYSTKNMTTASGGTAIDVLRNVPSVEVDATNNVSLRGNANVVVQINGRSSPLKGEQLGNFLAQLPASAVKNVEVATNPSAKNDPEGTAGIINIVLNQEAELGLSGGFTAGTGTTGMVNLSGNVGQQRGKLTLYASASGFRDERSSSGSADRTNLVVPVPASMQYTSVGAVQPRSLSTTFRSEYRFSPSDALSLDAIAYGGRFPGQNASYYTDRDAGGIVIGRFDQFNDRVTRNAGEDVTLAFRRTGSPQTTTFSTELRYSKNDHRNDVNLHGVLHQADASTGQTASPRERDQTAGWFPSWNLQTDYTHPFGAHSKLESGFKGTSRTTATEFSAAYFDDASAQFVPAPARATLFDYHERIGAAYAVFSQEIQKVQAQAGLRLEEASTRLAVPTASFNHDTRYGSAFPSAIVSYNFTATRQAKLSYSRRISRPNPFQLSPVEFRQDAFHLFRGNPDLSAEYTDAFELGLQESRSWGSVQLNPYLRRTAHASRYFQFVDPEGVAVSTFANLASATTVGTDLNVTAHPGPLTVFGGGSAYRYTSDASNIPGSYSARGIVWSLRANLTWKLSPKADLQSFANYRAPSVTEGGSDAAFVFMNVALRYKPWGDQGSITLRVGDPFNLFKFGHTIADGRVIEVNEQRFAQRGLFISVTRNFGQQLKLKPRQDQDPQAATPGPPGGP